MKKILIIAAMASLTAISSFGAACLSGVSLQTLINTDGGVCTVDNGAGATWTISNWAQGTVVTSGFGGATPTASDLWVSWTSVPGVGGFGAGFAVTFSDAPGGTNWFNTQGGLGSAPNQAVDWKPGFWVTSTGTDVVRVVNEVTGEGGNGQVNVQKIINTQTGINLGDAHVFYAGAPIGILTSDPAIRDLVLTNFSIVDHIILSATNAPQGGFMTSFTNTFYTATDIPEPMTFLLMGAGLVGIAALRRRS
jgi:hypothetical protein